MPARRSSSKPRSLQAPRVPAGLEALEVDGVEDEDEWSRCEVTGECSGVEADGVEIVESRLTGLVLTGSGLERLRATDVVFEGCELSGSQLEGARLTRVELRSCRMLGTVLSVAELQDVRFVDCRLDEVNLRMGRGEHVRFESCSLRGSDLYDSRFEDLRFLDCDLTGAQLSKARLPGVRLHGSTLDDIKGADALRGAVIASTQIVPLALSLFGTLGITIDDDRD